MTANSKNILHLIQDTELSESLKNGKIGLEKESLRILDEKISKLSHPKSLGSPLFNQYITTDFSEALMEMITPPLIEKREALQFLEDIHMFTNFNIGDELIWPMSMPPSVEDESDIKIADYGSSNLGIFKMSYRNGLSHRYGRIMQVISGIHFNYSIADEFFSLEGLQNDTDNRHQIKERFYFRMLRNIQRFNWLILYLFGASPIVSKNFIANNDYNFKAGKGCFYLPYATSLRMSNLGYQNVGQSQLNISLNSLDQYIKDLKLATETKHLDFEKISGLSGSIPSQINSNILQIEDEYYANSRPKSSIKSDERIITKLKLYGIDYLELRSIDLNPFSSIGIEVTDLYFLEAFLVYCCLSPSPDMTKEEEKKCKENDLLVATEGRLPNLKLIREGEGYSLKDWACELLEEIESISEYLNHPKGLIKTYLERVHIKDQTLSSMILEKVISEGSDFNTTGIEMAEDYKQKFCFTDEYEIDNYELFFEEANTSLKKQNEAEQSEEKSFQEFVIDYFS